MATRFTQVVAEKQIDISQVEVTSEYGSAGQSLTSAIATESVFLKNWNTSRFGVEYQIGSGAWMLLGPGMDVVLLIDLTATTLKVRTAEFVPPPILLNVEMYQEVASDPTRIVISSDAPSDSDGRPNGTIYIQTA